MIPRSSGLVVLVSLVFLGASSLSAQVRVMPKASKGGEKQRESWAEVPESFKKMPIPDWPMPTDLKRWNEVDRSKTRATLLQCLGDMPLRPDPRKVKVVSKEEHDDYTLERFEFHNGVDMVVPGILLHALIAPRPHLELSGDQDGGAPTDGIMIFEKKLIPLYQLHGKADNFRSVIYKDTGHEYLPEMREEMVAWFEKHLPVRK